MATDDMQRRSQDIHNHVINLVFGESVFKTNGLQQGFVANKIWWLCLVPTSTTRFASDVGYRMAKKWIGLYKEIIFYEKWHLTP